MRRIIIAKVKKVNSHCTGGGNVPQGGLTSIIRRQYTQAMRDGKARLLIE